MGLRSLCSAVYDLEYYDKLQGLFYNCLRETHSDLHDRRGYKFFCFSNIFPVGDVKEGDERRVVISSPDHSIIKALAANLAENIHVGEYEFQTVSRKTLDFNLKNESVLITSTPVVVRIPSCRYREYGINSEHPYVYWRLQHPANAFLKRLEENLLKKYSDYHGEDAGVELVFEELQSLKNPAVYVTLDGKRVQIIGSTWKFHINRMTPGQKKLLEFGVDCGLGELNTLGFGFVNPVRKNAP